MTSPDADVIVVGAGIAGSITATLLARAGHDVILVERGAVPGDKNLSGGVLYTHAFRQIFPGFVQEAPLERPITRYVTQFLNADSAAGIDYQDSRLADNAFSVVRGRLDPWLAAQAEAAGAYLMPGITVEDLLHEGGRVVGVRGGADELRARMVVAADGVNSFLARSIGLRPSPDPAHLGLGIKATFALDPREIERRFGLLDGCGAAWSVVGEATKGLPGGGFLYTNRDSVSLGVVVRLDALAASQLSAKEVFDAFATHPFLAPYIDGAELLEYGAHLVPEGAHLGPLAADGFLVVGDAAGLALNTGFTIRGMDLAAGSAIAAAEAINSALASNDASALQSYPERLANSFVGRDLYTYAGATDFLAGERLLSRYGPLAADVLRASYQVSGKQRPHLATSITAQVRAHGLKLHRLVADLIAAGRRL